MSENMSEATLVRRYRKDTNEMAIAMTVSHARRFSFSLPEELPFDHNDSDRIVEELGNMHIPPDEVQGPVASGLGDLVSDGFDVTFWDDKREDYEIMLDIEEAVRAGLRNRAWQTFDSGRVRTTSGNT